MRYVIIGNSTAGVGAIEGIRQVDKKGEITVITNEPHHTYARPLITYLLRGKVSEEQMKYRGDRFYSDHHCTLCYADVCGIDAHTRHAVLSDGKRVPYDKLLVATGSSAVIPPIDGLDTVHGKYTLMSLDDARKLDAALDKDKKVLIVGAGLIGLKCAESVRARVAHVTVLDLAPRVLSSILDETGAERVKKHLERNGIVCGLSAGVKRFEPHTAVLDNGERVDFDILVLAVGVRPNTSLLRGVAEIEQGIVINEKSETTAPGIYAAGDCTQSLDVSSGRQKVMALLPNAYRQGECAGVNMARRAPAAGGDMTFNKAIPMNAIGFWGLPIITAGSYNGESYTQESSGHYKRLFYSDNTLNGYILIGNVEKAGIYTSLIRERTPLDRIDFALICEKPGLMAFTKADRVAKLGGDAPCI